jgi:hypothetical protein
VADWVTISALATAGGTLALAGATYGSVRSANRSARVAEQALQEQRRPLLVGARLDDPEQKTRFADGRWIRTQGAEAVLDEDGDTVYLGIPVRNAGAGIAVLQGWHIWPDLVTSAVGHRQLEEFRPQIRDIYIAPGDIGLWQGALREGDREQALSILESKSAWEAFLLRDEKPETITRYGDNKFGRSCLVARRLAC